MAETIKVLVRGKIDEDGFLWLRRGDEHKKMLCPFDAGAVNCGDWCALFGEPWGDELKLCHTTLDFKVTDLRGKK